MQFNNDPRARPRTVAFGNLRKKAFGRDIIEETSWCLHIMEEASCRRHLERASGGIIKGGIMNICESCRTIWKTSGGI